MSLELPLPKYHQVYLVLREQLTEGRFVDGVPGELALVKQFGVARVTVRRALEKLAAEGLIDRAPGRGTTPRKRVDPSATPHAPQRRAQLNGLLENIVTMGLRTSVSVIECDVIAAPDPVADALRLSARAPVQKAIRVRSARDGPLSHITTWVPAQLAAAFGRRELARKPILVLLEESGVEIGRAAQTISARLADGTVARHLDVAVGSALLAVSRLVFDVKDQPVQWLHGLYRPDRYQYEMQLSRVEGIDAKVWVNRELSTPFH